MNFFYTFFLLLLYSQAYTQENDTVPNSRLEEVIIKAFDQSRQLREVAAAVNVINNRTLERFISHSIVHAVNTSAGVRMEERSPGSYRINIRGSSLRSPFGVRNVKVYYNDIPFTDPGGHTYLNSLGYYNFNNMEIIKGPGSSLYGAGTGGVLLIESVGLSELPLFGAEYTAGSYGLHNAYVTITLGNEYNKNRIGFQHQQSAGYRNHSALERNIVSWDGRYQFSDRSRLKTTFLYSNLFYETPGALTLSEFERDPRLSRPAGGGFPGAIENKASITQKTFLAGLSYEHAISEKLSNTTTAYGMFTNLTNPTVRNYAQSDEPHFGGRTVFSFKENIGDGRLQLTAGSEVQQSLTSVSVLQNKGGDPDTLQSLDDINTRQTVVFLQAGLEKSGWELTAGASLNYLKLAYRRSAPFPAPEQDRDFNNELAPRVSLAKKWANLIIYSTVAKGFSPPTTAELLPSGSTINLSLTAERGVNYDVGFRGKLYDISFDVNAFLFVLQNTIVQRRDAGGGDYFINAGKTKQNGIETTLQYPFLKSQRFFEQSLFWVSHTWHRFKYQEFKQLNNDFSGNCLPGVAPHTVSTGVDVLTGNGLILNVNYLFSDRIPLDDANSVHTDAYHLLHAKVGWSKPFGTKWRIRVSAGVENILDTNYSLGNDINAFGGRYYNAAPGRTFSLALGLQTLKK